MIGQGSKEFPALVCPNCAKEIGSGSEHMYLGWACKTPSCEQFHMMKHLGEKGKVSGFVPIAVAGKVFSIQCPKCGQRHDYRARELRQIDLPGPPPPGWKSLI
jgi:ssDNA-binding Zn-finger/Zn-ribbon topoisomerase 1